jgi:pimeloyl-ACP methyl ester carboxylesterase
MLFFGGSTSPAPERSPAFQAECVVAALRRLGVDRCAVVGFSYGGMVSFKMAEAHPDLVRSLVVSGSVVAMTDSISGATLERIGVKSSAELLLPETVEGLKALLSIATHRKLWFPDRIHRDYLKVIINRVGTLLGSRAVLVLALCGRRALMDGRTLGWWGGLCTQVMFNNRKERAELLEGLVVSNKDATVPVLPQVCLATAPTDCIPFYHNDLGSELILARNYY